jgi:hypothetical protein
MGVSMTRTQLLRKLLESNHLNVAERAALGAAPIHQEELIKVILHVLHAEQRFAAGEFLIERMDDHAVQVTRLVPDPSAGSMWQELPLIPVVQNVPDEREAARALLSSVLERYGQPRGTIDGISIGVA